MHSSKRVLQAELSGDASVKLQNEICVSVLIIICITLGSEMVNVSTGLTRSSFRSTKGYCQNQMQQIENQKRLR